MLLHANIRNTALDQEFPKHLEVGVLGLRLGEGGGWSKLLSKKVDFFILIFACPANIRTMFFDQKSPRHPEVGALDLRAEGWGLGGQSKFFEMNNCIFFLFITA